MKLKTKMEIIQYMALVLLFIFGAILFYWAGYNIFKFYVVLIFSFLYVLWGYWHHGSHNRLDKTILLEYALFSLVIVLLAGLGLGVIRFF